MAWINKIVVPQLDPALILLPQLHIGMPEQRSAPEPDISIITQEDHPSGEAIPLLVIEVSLTSLRYDRGTKSRLYARRGVPEYWILNVAEAVMETHRAPTGELWGERTVHGAGETLRPLLMGDVALEIDALLAYMAR